MFRFATPERQGGRSSGLIVRRSTVLNLDEVLGSIAESQFGVFSLEQARHAGIDASTLDKRVARGALTRVQSSVFAFPGTPPTWQRDATALVLSVPGLAAASHKTAAFIWGMSSIEPDRTEIVTVRHRRIRRTSQQIHESKDLRPDDVVTISGIPTTTAVRTVVDVGASASRSYVEHCLDTGLRLELFTLADLRSFIRRVARPGRNGIGKIRPLVEQRIGWDTKSESVLEDRFRRLIADSFLPAPVPQFLVRNGSIIICRADFAYPDQRILIELDGERYHMDRETFQSDRAKQNQAHALGWTVYRFTWHHILDEPEAVIATLASALEGSGVATGICSGLRRQSDRLRPRTPGRSPGRCRRGIGPMAWGS